MTQPASDASRPLFLAAAVQYPPVFLDLAASTDRACELIALAASHGAALIAFPETWLPGYPIWLDLAPGAALWDAPPAKAVFRRLFENSPSMDSPYLRQIRAAAKSAQAVVVLGINERAGNTLYNTMLFIDANGELLGSHRKLMPTYSERMLWGRGDGSTLTVVESHLGRVGGLICWEHWMPLARFALHAKSELVHVAQWPTVKEMNQVASRNYAFEGQCFVIAAGTVLQKQALTDTDLALFAEIPGPPDSFLLRGGSAIIAPNGDYLAGPIFDQTALLIAEIDPALAIEGRLTLDVAGHYSRPDIFTLHINTNEQRNLISG